MANGYLHHQGTKFYPAPYFPVGSIYLSTIDQNPSTYFGGTWVKVSGGYLYAADSSTGQTSYTGSGTQSKAAVTSGSTTLQVSQIPGHTHGIVAYGGSNQWATGYLWGRASGDNGEGNYVQGASLVTKSTGGGGGHTHSIPAHSHNVATVYVFMYKRTA